MSVDQMDYVFQNHDLTSLPTNSKEYHINEWLQDADTALESLNWYLYENKSLYSATQMKSFKYAARYFATTAKQQPNNESVALMLSLLYIALGEKSQGYTAIRRLAKKKNANHFIIWNACNAAIDANKVEDALGYAERLVQAKAKFNTTASSYEEHLKIAIDVRKTQATPKIRRAVRSVLKSLYETVLTKQPVYLDETRTTLGNTAKRNLNKVIKVQAKHARANHLAGYLYSLKCDWPTAYQHDTIAAKKAPDKYLYVLNAASSAMQLHKWTMAHKYLALAAQAVPGEQVRLKQLVVQEQLDDLLWSITYETAVWKPLKNKKVIAKLNKGIAASGKMIQLDKNNAAGYVYGGLLELFGDNYNEAYTLLKKANTLQPRTPEVVMALTVVALHMGKKKIAVEYASDLRALVPRDIEIFQNYLYALLCTKQYTKVLWELEKHNSSLKKSPVRELFLMDELIVDVEGIRDGRLQLHTLQQAEESGLLTGYSQGLDTFERTW